MNMKKYQSTPKSLWLSILLFLFATPAFSTTHTITNSGSTFSPATITINLGDTVKFVLSSFHNAIEVSESTWNANGSTALANGFQTAFGGGTVLPDKLGLGTHWYVCTNHVGGGMKAKIIVQGCTAPAQPTAINGNTSICANSSNTYNITAVSGATSYTWTLPNGWTGSSTTNSITVTTNAVGGTISVIANNACGSSSARSLNITVGNIPAQPNSISGNTSICENSSNTYEVTAVNGATSYTWSLPNGWTGSSSTNSITTTASATIGDISVTANNACGSSSARTLNITVNNVPTQPSAISGNTSICENSSNTYEISAVN